ncbi:sigma 54-interacting transcriptional regulator [Bacillus sp. EB106-08-02-XG196]|uniref:sigma-54 interaction domain-containing protein n=1 Tax=Bacillus sp. EB106-08-02-XG196 TaxID=2737049 RepID=UPI0015C448E6|nr:sigma 54-interacting transcriptional regulator [Bacillus sp. EB106-08-02-XG196]NWQ43422.1 sigma 54-interacting transcriptional regulator [Bacillus sp. EB106-08-02-XG196]
MRSHESTILLQVFETIFEFCYDPLYVIDGEGRFLKVNEAFSRFYGYSQKELIGKNIDEFFDLKGFSTVTAKKALEKGMRVVDEEVTGSTRLIRVTGIPVFNEDNDVACVVCNIKDITNKLEGNVPVNKQDYHMESEGLITEKRIDAITSRSKNIEEAFNLGKRIANVNSTVLILGESGVGKNVLSRFIHQNGYRSNGPFIEINCGAISESLLESELFGYTSGAFTGAKKDGKKGHIEMASNGTLFLDEVGEMSQATQVKLLHFLQSKTITRIGSSTPIEVDVRVIAATNKNVENLVRDGKFRQDLFYRLNVVPITVPPLRERMEDILPLIQFFIKKYSEMYGIEKQISQHALKKLIEYRWPGNVRELQNVIERLVVTTIEDVISVENLPENILEGSNYPFIPNVENRSMLTKKSIEFEAQEILSYYQKYGSTYKAAAALGMSQSTYFRKLRKYEKKYGDLFI